jgi:hypothetical protein
VKDRREYQQALKIIGNVVRAWDPYCLIANGAPSDELDGEIVKVTARVPSFCSPSAVALALSEIFSTSFGPEGRFSVADCSGPAEQIFMELGHAKLLPAA